MEIIINGKETGDIYHAAGALILNDNITVKILWGWQKRKIVTEEEALILQKDILDLCPSKIQNRVFVAQKKILNKRGSPGYATKVIAEAFERDSDDAVSQLKKCWLRDSFSLEIEDFLKANFYKGDKPYIIIWLRQSKFEEERNTTPELIEQLISWLCQKDITPILAGDPVQFSEAGRHFIDLREFWKRSSIRTRRAQLTFLNYLREKVGVIAAIGMKSGVMDGPALLGTPTIYIEFENAPNKKRMEKWLGRIPGYCRVSIFRNINKQRILDQAGLISLEKIILAKFEVNFRNIR